MGSDELWEGGAKGFPGVSRSLGLTE